MPQALSLHSGNETEVGMFVDENLMKTNMHIFASAFQLKKKTVINGTWALAGVFM